MNKQRIYTQKGSTVTQADKIELATLLIKMGYTVRLGKEKSGNGRGTTTFVEYWEGMNNAE